MKTSKQTLKAAAAITAGFLFFMGAPKAQSWRTDGNAGISSGTEYLGTRDVNDMVIRTNAVERGRVFGTGGTWRFGTAANYASIDSTGKLLFFGKGFYQVDKNKYVFAASNDPDIGMFYNSTSKQFEFRDKNALPVFFVNYETGAGQFNGSLKVGAYTLPATDGSSNQVLKTNGAGVLTWSNDNNGNYNAGAGLSLSGNTFSNTAPDQTVTLAGTEGINITGTYPNFSASGANLWSTTGNAGTSSATNFIGTTDNIGFVIRTSNLERMRIFSDGKIGIGTNSPNARLHVSSPAGEDALRVVVNGSTRFLVNDLGGTSIGTTTEAPANGLIVSGNVGIGDFTPTNKLDVAGNVGVTGNMGVAGNVIASGSGTGIVFSEGQFIKDNSANTNTELLVHGDLLPDNNASHSLGSSTLRWSAVWVATAMATASDARESKNVRNLDYGLKQIMQLRSVKFNSTNNDESGDKIGVIAQELQKVMPELVRDYDLKTDETTGKTIKVPSTSLGVLYSDMIPVLIKAIQELEQQIKELKEEKNAAPPSAAKPSAENQTNLRAAVLEQNAPNPFSSNTNIRYFVPEGSLAQIVVANNNGNIVKTFNLTAKGNGSVTIEGNELTAGTYYYTLIIDGKKTDSKKMILVK